MSRWSRGHHIRQHMMGLKRLRGDWDLGLKRGDTRRFTWTPSFLTGWTAPPMWPKLTYTSPSRVTPRCRAGTAHRPAGEAGARFYNWLSSPYYSYHCAFITDRDGEIPFSPMEADHRRITLFRDSE